jgi:hypothetical protein
MVQDDTSLAEWVAYILGPSSAAAQALAHVACIRAQGGRGCIFYAKGYWIVQIRCLDQHEQQRDACTADSIGQMAEDQSGDDESCGVGGEGQQDWRPGMIGKQQRAESISPGAPDAVAIRAPPIPPRHRPAVCYRVGDFS